jgi:hypothetical protein
MGLIYKNTNFDKFDYIHILMILDFFLSFAKGNEPNL